MRAGYHSESPHEVLLLFGTDAARGLSRKEARRRLKRYGPNRIIKRKRPGFLSIFTGQFQDLMVLTLLGATVISAAMGEFIDSLVIACIVALNAILGAVQEYKAEEALELLENYAPPSAFVVRDGTEQEIDREEVVPGDLLVLTPGQRVAADARLVEATFLQVEEAVLTGEALPVTKDASLILPYGTPLPERKNMVFAGTLITRGKALAVVTATGMETEMGKIAGLLSSATGQKTPLETRLESLGKVILVICLAICAVLGVLGLMRGMPFHEVFLAAVSLAVAAIPEGLPATVTLCLAIGVQRMAKNGAIVRKLEAIETLGSVTVICTDKTGTLTKNRMEVVEIVLPEDLRVPSEGARAPSSETTGTSVPGHGVGGRESHSHFKYGDRRFREILEVAVLASDARHPPGDRSLGEDPTEQAIVARSLDAGIDVAFLDERHPRLAERSFSPERRMMSTKVKTSEGALICVKGATDTVIPLCRSQKVQDRVMDLGPKDREAWEKWVDSRASKGMRVLAVAKRMEAQGSGNRGLKGLQEVTDPEGYQETGLVLLGCLVLADPLRPQAKDSVERCKIAGIRPVLVTGDHLRTAESVARETRILSREEEGITGEMLDRIPESQIPSVVESYRVFARVSPVHKLKIVRGLKKKGHVVAMTGDGINDAPALKEAAVGVAMGCSGTDVARESSSIILVDDDFSTIVKAIEEGRCIYENIRKFIRYLLSCNLGEVITMAVSAILGLPVPLSPIQLLWTNLVTDGLPALALSMEPPDRDIMKKPPRDPREGIFSHGLLGKILTRGTYVGGVTTLMFVAGLKLWDVKTASTMAFATLVTVQLVFALDCRSETRSFLEIGLFSNMYLVGACVISWLMLYATVCLQPLRVVFDTVPLSISQWLGIFFVSVLPAVFGVVFRKG